MVDVLRALDLRLSPGQFLEVANKISPRYFTVASSSAVQPRVVSLWLRVETFRRSDGDVWVGLFSDYIREKSNFGLSSGSQTVRYRLQNSCFALPRDGSGAVMVGTGTGVAPFAGVIQEKLALGPKSGLGELALVFGCRRAAEDFICQDLVLEAQKRGVLETLLTGFSQEGVG